MGTCRPDSRNREISSSLRKQPSFFAPGPSDVSRESVSRAHLVRAVA